MALWEILKHKFKKELSTPSVVPNRSPFGGVQAENHRAARIRRIETQTRLQGNQNAAYNAFHPKMPREYGTSELYEGWIVSAKLPLELSVQIFSFLSPQDLNAATWVSRAWRSFILNDDWLLSQVLDPSRSLRDDSKTTGGKDLYIRMLHRRLKADLYRRGDGTPRPRAHFVVHKLSFQSPTVRTSGCASLPAMPATSVVAAVFGVGGGPIAYLIVQKRDQPSGITDQRTLMVYKLDGSGRPIHIGSESYPLSEALPHESRYDNRYKGSSWEHQLTLSNEHASLRINLVAKTQYQSTDPPYAMITAWRSSRDTVVSRPLKSALHAIRFAGLTGPLRSLDARVENEFFRQDSQHNIQVFLSLDKQNEDHCLVLVAECSRDQLVSSQETAYESESHRKYHGEFHRKVIILPPEPGMLYRNSVIQDGRQGSPTKVFVIWTTREESDARSACLYLYEIPQPLILEVMFEKYAQHILIPQFDEIPLQGIRVRSIENGTGGVHSTLGVDQRHIGGLAIQRTDDEAYSNTQGTIAGSRLLRAYNLLVWGQLQMQNHVQLEMFEISTENYEKHPDDFDGLGNWIKPLHLDPFNTRDIDLRMKRPPLYGSTKDDWAFMQKICHCPLHDTRSYITLPRIEPTDASTVGKGKGKPSSVETQNLQSRIRPDDPPERMAALARVEAMYMKAIRAFQAGGFTDNEIADIWTNRPWSCWGQMRKPKGWQCGDRI